MIRLIAILGLVVATCPAQESQLWGVAGDQWKPESRLPDFSFAGYAMGEQALPDLPVIAVVTDFGATPNDQQDDTAAFQQALKQIKNGTLFIPAGRYLISDRIRITQSNVVLRGAGSASVLAFTRPLNDFDPKPTTNSGGQPTTTYSWSDGYLGITGKITGRTLCRVIAQAQRGSHQLTVNSTDDLKVGMPIRIALRDDDANSMMRYLYADDPGPHADRLEREINLVARITAIDGNVVSVDRALRMDLRHSWSPTLCAIQTSVRNAGIEQLRIEFPATTYRGHFSELGFNGIALTQAVDCWVHAVDIHNADSGLFLKASHQCTISELTLSSQRRANNRTTGHHGLYIQGGADHLISNFNFKTRFIHDLSVAGFAHGNVFEQGRGIDLCFDHHKWTPWCNLFTDIDLGIGSRMYKSGGGANRGRHCAAWTTWWNIRAQQPLGPPRDGWACNLINIVGLVASTPSQLDDAGLWFEPISTTQLQPSNLYRAQLKKRIGPQP